MFALFEPAFGPGAEDEALFFGEVLFDPSAGPFIKGGAAEPRHVMAGGFHFGGEFGSEEVGAAMAEGGEDFAVDEALFGGVGGVPDNGEEEVVAGDDEAAVAAIMIAGNGFAFPKFGWSVFRES